MQAEFFLPMFLPCFLLGGVWLLSFVWLVDKYTRDMTYQDQNIIWGGLHGRIYHVWCISALLSCIAAVGTWTLLFCFQSQDTTKQSNWDSSYIFPFPLIILSQCLYNFLVVQRHVGGVCATLWVTVGCTIWVEWCCWTIFRDEVWLHVLNAIWIQHGVLWDAGYWFFTWKRSLLSDSSMKQADSVVFTVSDSPDASEEESLPL